MFFGQIFLWWYLFSNIHSSAGQIFLHYNIIFGTDLVGEWWKIYLVPLVGIGTILLNYLVSSFFYSVDKFLARLICFWALLFHLFLTIGLVLLIRLNI
ncbi:MAG TPA: hypothetical protein VLK22_02225 [Candidatus Udaeobacter sp.]|nr:hypothetical protein [Candidatus Udaeobacter sp.]